MSPALRPLMRRRSDVRRFAAIASVVAATVTLVMGAGGAAQAAGYPVNYSFAAGIVYTTTHYGQSPLGANNWACKPTAAHPYPVVLAHGTAGNMTDSWEALSPLLANSGYCVYAFNYGGSANDPLQGLGPIETSAQQLSTFVDKVLAATKAPKVDIVGHSQGGMMPRYYLRFLGGAAKVDTLVGLAPSNHGTTLFGLSTLEAAFGGSSADVPGCAACGEQTAGSPFLAKLNAGRDTEPGVHYTVIETRYDEVVTPYTSAFLTGPNVNNVLLQTGCPIDFADHLAIIYDRRALALVLNALDPKHSVSVPCTLVLPVNGG